jgi:hypothetical protein
MLTIKKLSLVIAVTLGVSTSIQASKLDDAIKVEKSKIQNAASTQKKIDRYADSTSDKAYDYYNTLEKVKDLKAYNRVLQDNVNSQLETIASIQSQIDGIDATEKGVIPLMEEMIDSLARFVELDLPFKKEERMNRVNKLQTNMARADFSNSTKYQAILEAYQIEADYGSSVAAYQGVDEQGNEVDFIHFGRVALVYQSRDGKLTYRWNKSTKSWEEVDSAEYRTSIKKAIKIARGLATGELIKIPVDAAE